MDDDEDQGDDIFGGREGLVGLGVFSPAQRRPFRPEKCAGQSFLKAVDHGELARVELAVGTQERLPGYAEHERCTGNGNSSQRL